LPSAPGAAHPPDFIVHLLQVIISSLGENLSRRSVLVHGYVDQVTMRHGFLSLVGEAVILRVLAGRDCNQDAASMAFKEQKGVFLDKMLP
jgi:hypothetical protein